MVGPIENMWRTGIGPTTLKVSWPTSSPPTNCACDQENIDQAKSNPKSQPKNAEQEPPDQYADDTIFSCSGNCENILVIKRLLRWFEMVLGLKVNVDKSSLWGINVEHGIMENLGVEIGCEVGKTPFSYLGLNVSFNHRKISAWDNLVDRVKKKLEKWNGKHISFTGRITLVQAVLSAIPTYCLSLFLFLGLLPNS
ncbi:hypothetical protein ACS0TY_011571 [Phlomoides rotata]